MTERQKNLAWKWLGSMFMEEKNGQQAMSLTRALTVALMAQAMWIWAGVSEQPDLPDGMLWVLCGLLGVKSVNTAVGAIKGK